MNEYKFYSFPSDTCKKIYTNNFCVYLDNTLLGAHVYSIMISYIISGKYLNIYDKNDKRIISHSFYANIKKLSYYQLNNSIHFFSEY